MGASNNWAIHGNYTKNGKPIICNDPHLGNGIPSNWFIVTLLAEDVGGEINLSGAFVPGLPFPFIGKNHDLYFTITVNPADVTDLYEEKIEDN